jgi:hypothetical protein
MSLDVLTPRGQRTVADEQLAAAIWQSHNPALRYVHTPKNSPSAVDAVLTNGTEVVAVAETKCRYDLTFEKFLGQFNGEWLVTMDKVVKASAIASSLYVPLYGFLYLVEDEVLLTQRLCNEQGQFCVPFRCERTETRRTVNGGSIVRPNAYIDMSEAQTWRSNLPSPSPSSH